METDKEEQKGHKMGQVGADEPQGGGNMIVDGIFG